MEERKKKFTPLGSKLLKTLNNNASSDSSKAPVQSEANASGSLSTRANSNIKPYIEAF